jgi:N-acetylmuramoyl-L-alanine amidase
MPTLIFNTRVLLLMLLLVFGMTTPNNAYELLIPIEMPIKKIDVKQLACMANNIFYEAGSESKQGQAAVARVVMNRIQHGFGANPCRVVNQATVNDNNVKVCQFSWVCEGKGPPNKNDKRYVNAQAVAYEVMAMDMHREVLPKTALFFHNDSVKPNWPYRRLKRIGNHIFYAK